MPRRSSMLQSAASLLLLAASISSCYALQNPHPSQSIRLGGSLLSRHATVPDREVSVQNIGSDDSMQTPDMKAYSRGFQTVFEELPCRVCEASMGEIPSDLRGSYFRSGPAMFSAGSLPPPKKSIMQPKQPPVPDGQDPQRMVLHPMEGDGAILGVTFGEDGLVTARYRYVRTNAFTNERKKGQKLYKAMESTRGMGASSASQLGNDWPLPLFRHHLQPGLNKKRKNTSNTRAVYWGKRLLTLWEGGLPYKLDALALSTDGRSRLGGAIFREDDPFGCKMVHDAQANRALFYSVESGASKSELGLYEFDANFKLVENGRTYTELPGYAVLNDFSATQNYAVVVQPSITTDGVQFMLSKDPGKSLKLESSKPSVLHLIPRTESNKEQKSFPIPKQGVLDANLQFCNSYEDGGTIIIDAIGSMTDETSSKTLSSTITWPWASSLDSYRTGATRKSLWRYTVDTRSGSISKECLLPLHDCSFGVVNPAVGTQPHRFIYCNVGSMGNEAAPPQGILRYDCETQETQTWMPASHEFCGEPMFAPREGGTGEDDGYILSVVYNGEKDESELVILNANKISTGPLARIPLGVTVPHGLFGCFSSSQETKWPMDAIDRRAKLADKMESRGNMWNEVKSDFSGLGLRLDDIEEYFGDLL